MSGDTQSVIEEQDAERALDAAVKAIQEDDAED
jgi:hypothetical protein